MISNQRVSLDCSKVQTPVILFSGCLAFFNFKSQLLKAALPANAGAPPAPKVPEVTTDDAMSLAHERKSRSAEKPACPTVRRSL